MKSKLHNHPKIEEKLLKDGYITENEMIVDPEFEYLFEKSKSIWTSLHKGIVYVVSKNEYFDIMLGKKTNKRDNLSELI